MAIYKSKVSRDKNYSFKDGKLKLGKEDVVYGPQNDPNASPIDKAELVDPKRKEQAEKKWKLENEDGTTTDVYGPQNEPSKEEPKRNVDKLRSLASDLGIKEKSYAGTGKKYKIGGEDVEVQEGELSSGGDIHPGIVAYAQETLPGIKDIVGDKLRLTGGNDAYHVSDKYLEKRGGEKSDHGHGRAIDIAVTDPKPRSKYTKQDWANISNTWDAFKQKAGDQLKEGTLKNGTPYIMGDGWRVLNEYEKGSGASTGGHFHISILKDGKWVNADPHH